MARLGTELRDRVRRIEERAASYTDVAESYEELAELEALAQETAEDVTTPEGDELELVTTVEARESEAPARRGTRRGGEPAPDAARADAETYAVLPELDVLTGILDTIRAETARDDARETAPATGAAVA